MGTTTSTGNVNLVRSLGADEVIDYKMQDFQDVLRDYDAVLGTVRGDALEKALRILKPQSAVASLGGPPETEADWRRVADTLRRLHRLPQAGRSAQVGDRRPTSCAPRPGRRSTSARCRLRALLDAEQRGRVSSDVRHASSTATPTTLATSA